MRKILQSFPFLTGHTVRSRYQPCCTIYRNSPTLQFLTYSLAFSFKFPRIIWSYYNAIHLGHMWLNQGEKNMQVPEKSEKTLKIREKSTPIAKNIVMISFLWHFL